MSTTKMKTTLVAVLAALLLALGVGTLTTPAFAADATITVNGDQANHYYQAYQIFTGNSVASTADPAPTTGKTNELTAVQWGTAITDNDKKAWINALKADDTFKVEGVNVFAELDTTKDAPPAAPAVAKAISELKTAEQKAKLAKITEQYATQSLTTLTKTEDSNNYSATIAEGWYLIKDKDGTQNTESGYYTSVILQVVPGAKNEVDVKGSAPTSDKTNLNNEVTTFEVSNGDGYGKVADYNVGDAVPFRLHGTLSSNLADYDSYEYRFEDVQGTGFDTVNPDSVQVIVKHMTDEDTYEYYLLASNQYDAAQGTDAEVNKFTVKIGTAATVQKGSPAQETQIRDLKSINLRDAKLITLDDGKFKYENGALATTDVGDGEAIKITAADEIIVTYTANLNDDIWNNEGIFSPAENTMKVIYSNSPYDNGNEGSTPEDKTYTFSYKLDVTKYSDQTNPEYDAAMERYLKDVAAARARAEANGEDADAAADAVEKPDPFKENYVSTSATLPLSGAGFVLTREVTEDGTTYTEVAKVTGATTKIEWVRYSGDESWGELTNAEKNTWATENEATKTSDANGEFNYKGLDKGTYKLEEVVVPSGYRAKDPITIVITPTIGAKSENDSTQELKQISIAVDNGADTPGDASKATVDTDVYNTSGAELPETGGMGTVIFTVGGIALMLVAAVAFLVRRRNQE